jgi:hypothetical protein
MSSTSQSHELLQHEIWQKGVKIYLPRAGQSVSKVLRQNKERRHTRSTFSGFWTTILIQHLRGSSENAVVTLFLMSKRLDSKSRWLLIFFRFLNQWPRVMNTTGYVSRERCAGQRPQTRSAGLCQANLRPGGIYPTIFHRGSTAAAGFYISAQREGFCPPICSLG